VRFRIDGVLQEIDKLPKSWQKLLLARLKLLSKLKLNVEGQPQDGRMSFDYLGTQVDVRVATLPSAFGEGVVMRLLGIGALSLRLGDLGLRGKAYTVVEAALTKPNGMIATTGPTGSGKTTTLYAFISELNKPGVKIITLEDPIEYRLPGIQQTPIDHHVDFSFVKALRAVLRQDPDIVMVGEIRDAETADTALQAALTGHIVLTTLHTNEASGAIPRLITMGVKPFVIAPALNVIIAQRLVRKLCVDCKQSVQLTASVMERVLAILGQIPATAGVTLPKTPTFFHAPGCSSCQKLGYKGRIGIYEVIELDEPMRQMILQEASAGQIKAYAITQGMVTMAQDGLLKAMEGITDVEEVFRVAGE
jgi:type II secretory ATPase GspE/PulE/Tfp pilus assembly ATPase PilB-like protein